MLKKFVLSLLLFLFSFLNAISQEKIITIKDSYDKKVLPFASVDFFNGFGVFGDENGQVVLNNKVIDSVKISQIGYKSHYHPKV